MNTINRTDEEKNTKRIILLSSTIIVIIVSLIVGYILISTEMKDFTSHLKTFKSTLIEREKLAIKAVVDNLISDIRYEENSKEFEIKKRVKNQTMLAYELITMILEQHKNNQLNIVKKAINKISSTKDLEFFIYANDGTLILNHTSKIASGKNIIDLKDINGEEFIRKIVDDGGFVEYLWFVPKTNKISKKITYSIKIKELGITIGSEEFLDKQHSLNNKIVDKISNEKFGKNDFIFIYEIMSLSSSKNYSKLILEKNIITDERELIAIENILEKSDYKGDIFYEYDNKLTYSSFLYDNRTFISAGVDLNSIKDIVDAEEQISQKNLDKKIMSLTLNILGISIIFFIFSYIVSEKIERMFKNYRIKIAHSQQLLIQKSKMASMGEMIGNIAHQWRQPLSQLSGYFLDIESAYSHKELNQKYLTRRIDEANNLLEYMSKTIDDFKEFYNPNAKYKEFSILESIQNAIKIVESSLNFYEIKLTIDVDKALHVKGLSNELSQVILNIVSNAKDIAIYKDVKTPNIKIYTQRNDSKIFIHVEDNCGGIDEKNLDKIFEPYFTTKHNYGSGIGLYMSKVIIENKMNGKIVARNINKSNSRFTIILDSTNKVT